MAPPPPQNNPRYFVRDRPTKLTLATTYCAHGCRVILAKVLSPRYETVDTPASLTDSIRESRADWSDHVPILLWRRVLLQLVLFRLSLEWSTSC